MLIGLRFGRFCWTYSLFCQSYGRSAGHVAHILGGRTPFGASLRAHSLYIWPPDLAELLFSDLFIQWLSEAIKSTFNISSEHWRCGPGSNAASRVLWISPPRFAGRISSSIIRQYRASRSPWHNFFFHLLLEYLGILQTSIWWLWAMMLGGSAFPGCFGYMHLMVSSFLVFPSLGVAPFVAYLPPWTSPSLFSSSDCQRSTPCWWYCCCVRTSYCKRWHWRH